MEIVFRTICVRAGNTTAVVTNVIPTIRTCPIENVKNPVASTKNSPRIVRATVRTADACARTRT
jgi:hypothetical protein